MPEQKFLGVRSYYHVPYGTQLEVPSNITWVDFSRDLKSLYSKTKILMVPSSYESFCMVALEAMHNGIPVLYTRATTEYVTVPPGSTEGVEEWIEPAGIACRDVDEWVAALTILQDPEIYRTKSEEARAHAQTIPSHPSEAAQYVETFARENPTTPGRSFTIQNAAPASASSAPVLTAIPKPPSEPIGWRNGRLRFGRR